MVDFVLSEEEVRVLGALIEKSMATPEYYPLTLNALTNACNQKSNRNPVVDYDEQKVAGALSGLIDRQLAVRSEGGRVTKYAECFVANTKLLGSEAALLCLLLLRGPQTVGELRGRSERLYNFADLAEVSETLDDLVEMDMVRKLSRQPGRKESRYIHLFAGEGAGMSVETSAAGKIPVNEEPAGARLEVLTAEVEALKEELENLRQQFLDFKSQFD